MGKALSSQMYRPVIKCRHLRTVFLTTGALIQKIQCEQLFTIFMNFFLLILTNKEQALHKEQGGQRNERSGMLSYRT